jgi:uncharacterized membrane protein YfcA
MHIDLYVTLAGLVVGLVVGLTGMGGGALMTPLLVLLFHVQPLAAVSSDLVASMVMKPVGGAVHLRHGTVHRELVKWLVIGSAPAAFAGVLVIKALGNGSHVQSIVKISLGVALLVAVSMMVFRAVLDVRTRTQEKAAGGARPGGSPVVVRPLPTLLIGVLGGLVVGMTSVGSGSLIIVALLMLYPTLKAGDLVGTDLVQAVPLVASAALGHLLFGDFQLGLTASILIGSIPGVYVGARLSATAPSWLIRRAIAFVLLASALKLLDVSTAVVGWSLLLVVVISPIAWTRIRTVVAGRTLRNASRSRPGTQQPQQLAQQEPSSR